MGEVSELEFREGQEFSLLHVALTRSEAHSIGYRGNATGGRVA
jgi:hypothetical protein